MKFSGSTRYFTNRPPPDRRRQAYCSLRRGTFKSGKARQKARPDNPHMLPEHSIRFCLDYAGLDASEIDQVAYSFAPRLRRATFRAEWWADPKNEQVFLQRLGQIGNTAERVLGRPLRGRLKFVHHHLAHAWSAYWPSGFDRAAILVVDGIGEAACSTLARGEGPRIRTLETILFPNSLGFVWEAISSHLGFSPYDASKVMGLAAYGNPEAFSREFAAVIRVKEEEYSVDPEAVVQWAKSSHLSVLFGDPRGPGAEILPRHADIAAALQAATNAAVAAIARRLKRLTGLDRLCIAGGVALNCITNMLIKESSLFSEGFIPSAPHDAGTAIGAALAMHCSKGGARPKGNDVIAFSVRSSVSARFWRPSRLRA